MSDCSHIIPSPFLSLHFHCIFIAFSIHDLLSLLLPPDSLPNTFFFRNHDTLGERGRREVCPSFSFLPNAEWGCNVLLWDSTWIPSSHFLERGERDWQIPPSLSADSTEGNGYERSLPPRDRTTTTTANDSHTHAAFSPDARRQKIAGRDSRMHPEKSRRFVWMERETGCVTNLYFS